MISCSKARELMDSYLDGDISEADMLAFEDHISTCDDCRECYEWTSQIVSALRREVETPPADFTARVMARVRQEAGVPAAPTAEQPKKILPFFRSWKAYGSAAAAVLLLAVIGKTAVFDQLHQVTQPPAGVAYVDDAPNVPEVQQDGGQADAVQPEQAEQPSAPVQQPEAGQPQQPAQTGGLIERIGQDIQRALGKSPAAQQEQTQSGSQTAGTEESQVQPPPAQTAPADSGDMTAAPQANENTAEQPLLKQDSLAAAPEQETADMAAYHAAPAAEAPAQTENTADEAAPRVYSTSPAEPESSADDTNAGTGNALAGSGGGSASGTGGAASASPGGASGGGGGSSSGGASAGGGSSAASAAQPKVCYVTISKSGEGNLLAVQRRLSAAIDGTLSEEDGRLTVTVDAADFADTLAEIQATGFVTDVSVSDGTGDKSVFYIQ